MKNDKLILLTSKESGTAKSIRKGCKKAGVFAPTPQIVQAAVAENYQVKDEHSARTIGARLLQKPAFVAELGFASENVRGRLFAEILDNLHGENKVFGKDRDIYRDSLKIACRLAWPEKTTIIHEDDPHANRTDAELEHFIKTGRWPEADEDSGKVC